ncbi:MAG: hypothetical protein ACLP05_12025 [Candidatus Kryptoniota bacterium]
MKHKSPSSQTKLSLVLVYVAALSLSVIIFTQSAGAQSFSADAGLGFEYFQTPSISQYVNYEIPGTLTPGTFTTGAQFVVGAGYFLSNNWELGLEYGYILKSYSGSYSQVNYSFSLPSITLTRIEPGDGYYLSYGAAIGYHFASLDQTDLLYSGQSNYSAGGIGIKIDAGIDTKLGDNFYARITADARGEFIGNFKSQDGTQLFTDASDSRAVNGYLSGVGITFQLVYYF